MANALNWFEIPAVDYGRAERFYNTVFGTKLIPMEGMEGFQMGMFPAEDGVGGGVVQGEGYVPSVKGTLVYLNAGDEAQRLGNVHPNIVPYQVFRAQDKYIIVAVGTQRLWERFCQALGLADTIMNDPRFVTNPDRLAHRAELVSLLQDIFSRQPADHWLEALREAQIPSGPINSLPETLSHPQLLERGFVVDLDHPLAGLVKSLANPIGYSDTPVSYRLPPPTLGEHNATILSELGFTPDEVSAFAEGGVI